MQCLSKSKLHPRTFSWILKIIAFTKNFKFVPGEKEIPKLHFEEVVLAKLILRDTQSFIT